MGRRDDGQPDDPWASARANASRNAELLLAAARELLDEPDSEVALDEVARSPAPTRPTPNGSSACCAAVTRWTRPARDGQLTGSTPAPPTTYASPVRSA